MECPRGILTMISCDSIAECHEVSEKAYRELWSAMEEAKPLSELISIEDSCPNDAIGLNTPAEFWNKFSDEVKEELIELHEKDIEDDRRWREEFDRKYPPRK